MGRVDWGDRMLVQRLLAIISLFALVQPTPINAQSVAIAKPQGQWVVDFADDHCLAGHKFLTSYGETVFQFQPDMMRRHATINIIVPKGAMTDRQWGEMKVDWTGRIDETDSKPIFQVMKLSEDKRVVTFSIETDGMRASPTLELRISFEKNPGFAFQLPNWGSLQTLLDQCAADLRVSKGFPGPEYDLAKVHAKAKIFKYFSDDDYPKEALQNNEQGEVWVLFWVDADGRVSNCTIDKTSGSKSLDATTCKIIQKVRFDPAIGQDGKPIREPSSTRLRWHMPN